jgi:hypothetical protein
MFAVAPLKMLLIELMDKPEAVDKVFSEALFFC